MDNMLLAKWMDWAIDIFAAVLIVYVLIRIFLKKRRDKKTAESDSFDKS